ncbi:MAG: nucleotidyltransferase family protein [Pirellulales bacterium]
METNASHHISSGPFDAASPVVVPYEKRLSQDWEWAMAEGSRFFDGTNKVHATMQNLAKRLEEMRIPYAVVGGMALTRYEYKRFTDDLDVLVTQESLDRIHKELEGRGYVLPFKNSKHLRDTDTGVKVEFHVSGQYPGDGKPKPVAFPDPSGVAEQYHSIHFLSLAALIELKLASGISNADRGKDLVDVRELIVKNGLDRDYADKLNPYVREPFLRIWDRISENITYLTVMTFPTLSQTPQDWSQLFAALPEEKQVLLPMQNAGLELEPSRSRKPNEVWFKSNNPALAKTFDMHSASDYR